MGWFLPLLGTLGVGHVAMSETKDMQAFRRNPTYGGGGGFLGLFSSDLLVGMWIGGCFGLWIGTNYGAFVKAGFRGVDYVFSCLGMLMPFGRMASLGDVSENSGSEQDEFVNDGKGRQESSSGQRQNQNQQQSGWGF